MNNKLLIYEYDCFCSLLLIDNKILDKLFSNIIVPKLVYDKFLTKCTIKIKSTATDLIRKKFIVLEDFDVTTPEYIFYKNLNKGINCKCRGKCESAAITIAKQYDLPILSNNSVDFMKEFNINTLSLIDIITKAYENNKISLEDAEVIWSNISSTSKSIVVDDFTQYFN